MSNNIKVNDPSIKLDDLRVPTADELDTSLRMLVDYHIGTDSLLFRLDALLWAPPSQAGARIGGGNYPQLSGWISCTEASGLASPKVQACMNYRVRGNDLVSLLRGMADKLEEELKKGPRNDHHGQDHR